MLIDAIGGRLIDSALIDHMTRCGVQVEWFRTPVWQGALLTPLKHNHRTHRKVLVVDQRIGFTGGVGIAEEWCGDARDETEWRDTHVRVVGPAVDGLAAAFAQNWAETGHTLWEERRRASPSTRPSAARSCRSRAAAPASAGTTWRRRSGS